MNSTYATCQSCKKSFSVDSRQKALRDKAVFCSRNCNNNRIAKVADQDVRCLFCNEIFIKKGSKPPKQHQKRKFCSKRCNGKQRGVRLDADKEQRFWRRVNKPSGDNCWEWQGQLAFEKQTKTPYGIVRWGGKMTGAHRVAYCLTKGAIREGMYVLHSCDNPPCCNPSHLRQGTHQENMADIVIRQRQPRKARNENPATKMREEKHSALVEDCREASRDRYGRVEKGTIPFLANKWGVSRHIVKRAIAQSQIELTACER
jgi:hypothetical protein